MEHFTLSGRRALVIGGDTPSGRSIASAYGEAGADVEVYTLDVSQRGRVEQAVRHAASALGGLDILACCPDRFLAKPVDQTTDAELEQVINVNFRSQFAAVRAAAVELRKSEGGGKILLLSHVLGKRGARNTSAYGAAHAATQSLVRSLAQELGPDKISINGIALGWMDWMEDRIDPKNEEAARAVRFTSLKRTGRADEIGAMAVWLSGSGAGFVTGQVFGIDGGLLQHL